jgi:hypothetical protein
MKIQSLVIGEMFTRRYMQAGLPQDSVLSPTLYNLHINDPPQLLGVHLPLFADDTCLYATDRKEGYFLRKLQEGSTQWQRDVNAGI